LNPATRKVGVAKHSLIVARPEESFMPASANDTPSSGRFRILKLVRRGDQVKTGKTAVITPEPDQARADGPMASLYGETVELVVDRLGPVYGYLWREVDGSLSYESIIEDAYASRLAATLIREANAYLDPTHQGIFDGPLSPSDVAWIRQGKTANQIYASLVWMPLNSRSSNDSLFEKQRSTVP
jgi:hypothetical protein